MNIIKSLRDRFRYWLLRKAHRQLKRVKKLRGYKEAQTFGIMYDASSEEDYRQITLLVRDLQQDHKKVKTLGYVMHKKMPDYCFPKLTFEFCKASDFSWKQHPASRNVKEFIAHKYDVLIDFTPTEFAHIKYLAAISDSTMKVGAYEEKYLDVFDLLLQMDHQSSLEEKIKQTIHYLKMINNDQFEEE